MQSASFSTPGINVDLFAGGGGASEAFYRATGRHPDVAVNHNPVAIFCHALNHPQTRHYACDIREVNPLEACTKDGMLRRIDHLHASPDCTHFSKARGGKPVEKRIRSLADVVVDWVAALAPLDAHPRLITLENVEEFQDWGPVLENGKPCPDRKGIDFRRWVKSLESFGYVVKWWEVSAADFGAPTTRNRLFLVARRDGEPIILPASTHASRKTIAAGDIFAQNLKPYRSAADDVIDWSIRVPSIFGRKIALKAKTQARIGKGIKRYVIDSPRPFIVNVTHTKSDSAYSRDGLEPIPTATTAKGGEMAVSAPTLMPLTHAGGVDRVYPPEDPTRAVTAAHRGEMGLSSAFLKPRYSEREGQEPRALTVEGPYPNVVPGGNGGDLAVAHLTKFSENSIGTELCDPLHTAMAGAPRHGLVAAHITRHFGTSGAGLPVDGPAPTVMGEGGGGKTEVVATHLSRMTKGSVGSASHDPTLTTTAHGKDAVVAATLVGVAHGDDRERAGLRAWDAEDPLRTVSGSNDKGVMAAAMLQHNGDRVGREAEEPTTTLTHRCTQQQLMAVCLDKYYATGVAQAADRPIDAITAKARFSNVAAFLEQANTGMVGHEATAPVSTIVGKGCTQRLVSMGLLPADSPSTSSRAHVLDFLWTQFGAPTEEEWADPMDTARGRLRFGLVNLDGVVWMIVDIGMRMLTPRELFNAQGFRRDYIIDGVILEPVKIIEKDGRVRIRRPGRLTKTEQTSMAGNSVSPPPLEAILRANLTWMDLPERIAA